MNAPLQTIRATGDFFTHADGSEFHYVGSSDFGQFKRMCMDNGPEALVRPLLVERRQVVDAAGYHGPIVLRVFRTSDPGNAFGQVPSQVNFERIDPFLQLCAEYQCYVDFTQGDDDHSMMFGPNLSGLEDFHNKFTSYIKHFCFYETENEPFKNGQAPQRGIVPPPSPFYLRDSGNYVDINEDAGVFWESAYDLDAISYHDSNRDSTPVRWPKWVCNLDDSIAKLRSTTGKPTVLKETAKFGVSYTDPAAAHELGLRASMGGVVFHSQLGLESNGWDEATKQAAGAFFRGAAAAIS